MNDGIMEKNGLLHQGGDDYLPLGPVPVTEWGECYWSLLIYLEDRCLNHEGLIDNRNLRCLPNPHPMFAHGEPLNRDPESLKNNQGTLHDPSDHPTRLKGGKKLWSHDDWSIVEDFVAHGLVKIVDVDMRFDSIEASEMHSDGPGVVTVELTETGYNLASEARKHWAQNDDRRLGDFEPNYLEALDMDTEKHEEATDKLRIGSKELEERTAPP